MFPKDMFDYKLLNTRLIKDVRQIDKSSPFQRTQGSQQQCFGGNLWRISPLIWSQKAHVWEDMFTVQLFQYFKYPSPHFVVNLFPLNSLVFNVFSLLKSASSLLHLQPLFWIFHQIQCMSIVSNPCASLILWMGSHVPKLAGRRTSLRTEVKSHRSSRLASRTTKRKTSTSRRPRWSTTAPACSTGLHQGVLRSAFL